MRSSIFRALSAALPAVLLVAPGHAQLSPRHAIVAAHDPSGAGGRRTLLLDVDLAGGTLTPFGRFGHDLHAPLAVGRDPIRDEVLLAVDLGGGTSRVLRLAFRGTTAVFELPLADVPGRVSGLAVAGVSAAMRRPTVRPLPA